MYVETKVSSLQPDGPVASKSSAEIAILLVDDDPNILDGLRRHLHKKFRIHTALGAAEALADIATVGPFGVVISDLQMPGMDGIQFLMKVRAMWPDTIRVMLTGRADISTAMAAVNQGNIFRFLVKPCAPIVIEKVLEAAVDQYKLVISERQLTQETLLGCLKVMLEMLTTIQPDAFSHSTRVHRHVREIAAAMNLKDRWQVEAAAMLLQIGWMTLPPDVLAKATAGEPMSSDQQTAFAVHPAAGARILEGIPRLGTVARMVEGQHGSLKSMASAAGVDSEVAALGAQVLKAAIEFDRLCKLKKHPLDVLDQMKKKPGAYMPEVLAAMAGIEDVTPTSRTRLVPVSELVAGMVMAEDLCGERGLILVGKGQAVTATFAARLSSVGYGLPRDQMCKVRA